MSKPTTMITLVMLIASGLLNVEGWTGVAAPTCFYVVCSLPCAGVLTPAAIVAGSACAACASLCFCFDANTTQVEVPTGFKSIRSVVPGELVRTLDAFGRDKWTEVIDSTYVGGEYRMASFTLEGQTTARLTVSEGHPMVVVHGANYTVVKAKAVRPGDSVQVTDGSTARVAAIDSLRRNGKVSLTTTDCTVLANGVHTATACDDPVRQAELTAHAPVDQLPSAEDFDPREDLDPTASALPTNTLRKLFVH